MKSLCHQAWDSRVEDACTFLPGIFLPGRVGEALIAEHNPEQVGAEGVSDIGEADKIQRIFEGGNETRVLITGANGFVGRHLIAQLLEVDARPVNIIAAVHVDHVAQMQQEPAVAFDVSGWVGGTVGGRVSIVGMELSDADSMESLAVRFQPQQIYHLAARASGADVDRDAIFAANVQGTRHLLEGASRILPFPRVLLASTGYVYGNTEAARPAMETDPIGPLWKFGAYADSKIEMENVAKAYRGLTLVARAFAHTGPGQSPAFAMPAFARQIARMERGLEPPVLHVGNLNARRDLMDVRDVCRAYAGLMNSHAPTGTAFNVCTGRPVRLRDVVEQLCRLSAVNPEIVVDPARLRPLDIACSTGDSSRLRAVTEWEPQRDVDATLRDLLDYWRSVCN